MSLISNVSVEQLRKAANLKEKIAALETELAQLLGSTTATKTPKKKGGMSAAGKARIAAAQKIRWAKVKAGKSAKSVIKTVKMKFKMSAAGRARIAAAAKARWAKVKAAGKKSL